MCGVRCKRGRGRARGGELRTGPSHSQDDQRPSSPFRRGGRVEHFAGRNVTNGTRGAVSSQNIEPEALLVRAETSRLRL